MRHSLVEDQLNTVVGQVHDVSEHGECAARIGHGGDLWRHDDDQALRPFDYGQGRLTQRGAQVDDDDALPADHYIENAAREVAGH